MQQYSSRPYPRENGSAIAVRALSILDEFHFNKKDYAGVAKLFRSATEFGNYSRAQNSLKVIYNAGIGVEKNDITALY